MSSCIGDDSFVNKINKRTEMKQNVLEDLLFTSLRFHNTLFHVSIHVFLQLLLYHRIHFEMSTNGSHSMSINTCDADIIAKMTSSTLDCHILKQQRNIDIPMSL